MFPVLEPGSGADLYRDHLAVIRQRILGFALRRLVPHQAGFADAEEIAQSSIVVLWEKYPEKRELSEMMGIAVGIARNKIAQFRRERSRDSRPDTAAEPEADDLFEQTALRESADRFLRAMLQLGPRCRDLLRLKLVEQLDYAEIRLRLGITGNIYEMTRRCHAALLRIAGGTAR